MDNLGIVTVYNNVELFSGLQKSVSEASDISCKVIAIDNRDNMSFSSAAAAYNSVLALSPEAEVLVFCHQDIVFLNNSLLDIFSICKKEPFTLFGAAGVKNSGHGGGRKRIISSMALIQEGWNYESLPKGTTQDVFSLDECLICGSRELFSQLRFDDQVCDGWHLYATELCMQCHVKGIPVKVFDADIVHLSGGNQDKSFYDCEKKLVKKYRKKFPLISYTCGWAYTDPIRYWLLTAYRKLRYGI